METTVTAKSGRPKGCSNGTSGEYQSVDPAADMAQFTEAMRVLVTVPKADVLRVEAEEKATRKANGERAK